MKQNHRFASILKSLAAALVLTGLLAAWPGVVQAQEDLTPPETAIDSGPADPSLGGVTFTFSSSEDGSTFECQMDAGGWAACASPQVYIVLSAVQHTFAVRATDAAGNVDATPASFTWTVAAVTPAPAGIVSAGAYHTCALTPSGAVDCWGYNNYGQAADQQGPYTQVSAGSLHTCALTPSGAVDCWGRNEDGQAVDQIGPYTEVSAGAFHTCALTPAGAVDCWGWNEDGQAEDQVGPYTQVSAGYGHTCALTLAGAVDCWGWNEDGLVEDQIGPYTQVSAGNSHTCALTPAGAVDCWGWNEDGQAEDQIGPYTQVSAGGDHTCALTPSGAVDCWGWNADGQAVDQTGPYTQVSAGFDYTCALTPSGAVDCWGWNVYGQAEDQSGPYGPYDGVAPETAIDSGPADPSLGGVTFTFSSSEDGSTFECQMDAGGWAACASPQVYIVLSAAQHTFEVRATDAAGNVDATPASFTWTVAAVTPAPAGIVSANWVDTAAVMPTGVVHRWGAYFSSFAGPYTQVSVGYKFWCMLTPSANVDCIGLNDSGQAVSQLGPFIQVEVGYRHACALTPAGAVDCWGDNSRGQAADQQGPYTQFSAGEWKTCGLTPSGDVHCWGWPSAKPESGPYTQVSAGNLHTCALTPSGAVDCASSTNLYGQADDQPGPYIQVSAGADHTCALTPSGAVDCWGDNRYGKAEDQLGPYVLVSAGTHHTCALSTSGAVDCWGPDENFVADQPGPYGPYVQAPAITTEPQSQAVFIGDAVSFSAAADGYPVPTLQWQVSADGGATWSDIDGAIASPLEFIAATAQNGTAYRAVFTNSGGSATSEAAVLTVNKLAAALTLDGLSHIYDGQPKQASVTTDPAGLSVILTYDGSPDAPVGAGSYAVLAVVDDPNYQGSANGTLVIAKADAAILLSNLEQTYDGQPKQAGVTTDPAGLSVVLTYDGSPDAPVGAGSYAVLAVVDDPNYQGSANGTLVIAKAAAAISLSNLEQTYDGQPKPVSVTTDPAGLSVDVTYDGSATPPAAEGSYAVLAMVNEANYTGEASGTLIIITAPNGAPVAQAGGPYLGAINTAILMDGSASSDPDGDPLTYAWDFGDGSSATEAAPVHTYSAAAVYNVCLVVNDGTVDSEPACTLAVAYDPNGGFVTGGGWINSPAGAYLPDPALTGRATFGFVSKYKKGQSVPTGNTEFQFAVAGFNFHSETYEWLVINKTGTNAQFKGSGTVNGGLDPNGNKFKFMIWAGDSTPNNGADTFRIRIWWEADGVENDVYDNDVEQPIGGGSIVIHTR